VCNDKYYHRPKKTSPPLQRPLGHRCVAVAYLSSASANHLPDSELRQATATYGCPRGCRGGMFFLSMIELVTGSRVIRKDDVLSRAKLPKQREINSDI